MSSPGSGADVADATPAPPFGPVAAPPFPDMVLLDREGVLLHHIDPYIVRHDQVRLIDHAAETVARLTELGITVAVVTNQSCINRGLASRRFVDEVCGWLLAQVRRAGGDIAQFHVCPHRSDEGCRCRKPEPGMLRDAMRAANAAPHRTWVIGDHDSDVAAGRRAQCGYVVHVRSGRQAYPAPLADASFATLAEAVSVLLRGTAGPGGRDPGLAVNRRGGQRE